MDLRIGPRAGGWFIAFSALAGAIIGMAAVAQWAATST